MTKRVWLAVAIVRSLLMLGLLGAPAMAADDYPMRKSITLVTPYAPGGGSDILTRILGEALRTNLQQNVVVQNVTGAGGALGSRLVAQANPDGYTLLSHHIGLVTSTALYKNPQFDPTRSYEYVGLFADTPMVLVSSPSFPANNVAELIAYVKQNKDRITFASSGKGSATHLCSLLFEKALGVKVTLIQYKGASPATIDVTAGRVDLFCDVTAGTIIGAIQSGSLKAFFITSPTRLKSIPNVPTANESGLKEVNVSAWYGLYAPAGTPKPVIDKLSEALQTATQDPTVALSLAKMETLLFDTKLATPEALKKQVESETTRWTDIIQQAGISPE